VWPGTFAMMLGILLARSSFLFTTRLYECCDPADNSILVLRAQRFSLLHGNYSREGFFHPGPGYIYVMAAGQTLFHDLLHLVPTQWNAQLIAIFLLNSALIATIVWITHSWTRSAQITATAAAVILGFLAAHPLVIASGWFPYLYVPTFGCFLVAAASVAAGRTAHLWILVLTGSLAVHGHVEFLFFVPAMTAAAGAAALWPHRRALRHSARRFATERRSHWAPALAIAAVFAWPIAAAVILHWPGQFGSYLSYAGSAHAGHHCAGRALRFALWYWLPGPPWPALLAAACAGALAFGLAVRLPNGGLRRFIFAALWMNAVTSALMLYYALRGIDFLSEYYIGYFYWSVPLLTVIVVVTALAASVRPVTAPQLIAARVTAAALTAAAVAAALIAPALKADVHDSEPELGPATAALVARAAGRPIILHVAPSTSYDADGLIVQAERMGARACLTGAYHWIFAITSDYICGAADEAAGVSYQLHARPYHPGSGVQVIGWLRYSILPAAGSTVHQG
jgi:hypothetical protein